MADDDLFTGIWHCVYWYPSNEFVGNAPSEYDMKVKRTGDNVVFESLPNEEKSYMLVRLHIDGDVATGTWHESTSPTGFFKGAQYSGAGQLIIDSATQSLEGKWAGAGLDRKLNKMNIYKGNWELTKISENGKGA